MSDAIENLYDYLAKSPSVIYPEDALAYLPAIEVENAKLRELLDYALPIAMYAASTEEGDRIRELMREVEV